MRKSPNVNLWIPYKCAYVYTYNMHIHADIHTTHNIYIPTQISTHTMKTEYMFTYKLRKMKWTTWARSHLTKCFIYRLTLLHKTEILWFTCVENDAFELNLVSTPSINELCRCDVCLLSKSQWNNEVTIIYFPIRVMKISLVYNYIWVFV